MNHSATAIWVRVHSGSNRGVHDQLYHIGQRLKQYKDNSGQWSVHVDIQILK